MRVFVREYRWHLIFFLLIMVCVLFIFVSSVTKVENDMIVGYVGDKYVNTQSFNDNKAELELLLIDSNKDKKRHTELLSYTVDLQKDIDELFTQMVESESYHIYISSKKTFKNYKDKDCFADLSGYIGAGADTTDVLKDAKGRVYAISLEGNTLAERLGIVDTKELYIGAAFFNGDSLTDQEKNGMNITGYIIENKQKYS